MSTLPDTPLLDELESGPCPSFVTGLKRLAADNTMMAGLLRQQCILQPIAFNDIYDKVRWIDQTGMEWMRVHFVAGYPEKAEPGVHFSAQSEGRERQGGSVSQTYAGVGRARISRALKEA